MPKLFLHHIDIVNDQYVRGWCFNRLFPRRTVTLQIRHNRELIGEVQCNQFRKDVQKAELHRSGHCGFEFHLPRDVVNRNTDLVLSSKGLQKPVITIPAKEIQPVLTTSPPIFFMHIPKTAGTSFNNHVQSWFAYDHWHIHTETYNEEKLRSLASPGAYLAGHLPLYKLQTIFPDLPKIKLHAILRDPLNQIHSHLAWIKGIGLNAKGDFFRSHPPVVQELAIKLQDQVLQTPDHIVSFIEQMSGFEWDFFDNIQTRYFLNRRPDQVTASEAKEAVENLRLFSSVGLTEHYDTFLSKTAAQYERRSGQQLSKHNQTRVTPLFNIESREIQEALQPLIRFDLDLYQAVKSSSENSNSFDT